MSHLFSPFSFHAPRASLPLPNRIVIAPMCQYSADQGKATDWHLAHWAQMLNSGAGLFIIEATAVEARGRISTHCLGLWDDVTAAAMAEQLHRARHLAPAMPVCIQLAHAGRKASSDVPWRGGQLLSPEAGGWPTCAPSAIAHLPQETPPHALTEAEMHALTQSFVQAAGRAEHMGIEAIELHAAHGYLLHQFLSPLSNQRTDAFGGNFENRIRFPLEVFQAVRAAFKGTLGMRLSATDWVEGGLTPEDTADFCLRLKQAGADFVHISSGGVSTQQKIAIGPEYQVPFAKLVKQKTGLPTIAVGMITDPHQADQIIARGDADLVALARTFLYKPRWGWEAASALKAQVHASPQYWRCLPSSAGPVFADVKMGQR